MIPEARLLSFSAALLFLASSLAGVALLIPLQPWGQPFAQRISNFRSLVAGHVDWVLLAAMQLGAAFAMTQLGAPTGAWVAWLIVAGAWLNPMPYFVRGFFGVNAMVFAGGAGQRVASTLGIASSTSIIIGWSALLFGWVTA